MSAFNWRVLMVAGLVASTGLAPLRVGAQVADPKLPPKPPFADPKDAIAAREAGFRTNNDIVKAFKAAVEGGQDVAPFAADAQWMVAWSKQIPDMFPPGSETGRAPGADHDTKALPAIWSDKAGFDKDAANFGEAAAKLATLAEAGDKAAFAKQFQALGGTCGACHRAFRVKDPA